MANGFLSRTAPLGSLRAFLGAPTPGDVQATGQREKIRIAALQAALENLPIDAPNRPELEASLGQLTGVPTIGMAFRPAPPEPQEPVKLGAQQRLVNPTTGETLIPALPGGAGRETETQRGIAELQRRGFSREDAEDIQRGRVKVSTPDAFGNIFTVNVATGERRLVRAGEEDRRGVGLPPPETAPPTAAQPAQPPGLDPLGSAMRGVGPIANIQQLTSNIIGPFVKGTPFQDTVEARQRLGLFNKTLERSLVNNPRFPVAERERVQVLLPDTERFFLDPDAARAGLIQTRDYMRNLIAIKESEMESPAVTTKRRTKLADQVSVLRESLGLFGAAARAPGQAFTLQEAIATDPDTMTPEQQDAAIQQLREFLNK